MAPLTFCFDTNPHYLSHLRSRLHLQDTFLTDQSIMVWKQDNMSTKGTWHRGYFCSHYFSKWQLIAAGDTTPTPITSPTLAITRLPQEGLCRHMTGGWWIPELLKRYHRAELCNTSLAWLMIKYLDQQCTGFLWEQPLHSSGRSVRWQPYKKAFYSPNTKL